MNPAAARAINNSSSVRMTRTATRPSSVEMTGALAALRRSSREMPGNSSPSQMRCRVSGEFSPIPPPKTRVPRQPSRRQSPEPCLCPVAEQCNGLGRPDVNVLAGQEIAEVVAGFGDTERDELRSEEPDVPVNNRRLIRGLDRAVFLLTIGLGHDEQPGPRHPDPLDATGEEPLKTIGQREQRELEARRAAANRQDVGSLRPLGLGVT